MAWTTLFFSCSLMFLNEKTTYNGRFLRTDNLLVLVDNAVYPLLEQSLSVYRTDLESEGVNTIIEQWTTGTAADLRSYIADKYRTRNIDGVFLVGDLPAAWYAMYSSFHYEEFPCDLYLMDPDSEWLDTNQDRRFDGHSALHLKLYVSRITGNGDELVAYFEKVHRYRSGELRLPAAGFVFKDDDWFSYRRGSNFGLGLIYETCDIHESIADTQKDNYLKTLNDTGYEFVYQWIHSYPSALCVKENTLFRYITTWTVEDSNVRGHFYNLYDCSAARFTQLNLGMTYLVKTDYGLAVFGSTKVGGCYFPLVFNQVLSQRGTWGDAFLNWYNYYGNRNDSWYLGMVILGDPTLVVSVRGPVYRFIDMSLPAEPDANTIRKLEETGFDFLKDRDLTGFDAYREAHPDFF